MSLFISDTIIIFEEVLLLKIVLLTRMFIF